MKTVEQFNPPKWPKTFKPCDISWCKGTAIWLIRSSTDNKKYYSCGFHLNDIRDAVEYRESMGR